MSDVESRVARAMEQFYGDEGLTGDLDDAVATRLLEWGGQMVRIVCATTAEMSDEEADTYLEPALYNLRRTIRRINKLVGDSGNSPAEQVAGKLQSIMESAGEVPGLTLLPPDNYESAAQRISSLPAGDALEVVLSYFA